MFSCTHGRFAIGGIAFLVVAGFVRLIAAQTGCAAGAMIGSPTNGSYFDAYSNIPVSGNSMSPGTIYVDAYDMQSNYLSGVLAGWNQHTFSGTIPVQLQPGGYVKIPWPSELMIISECGSYQESAVQVFTGSGT